MERVRALGVRWPYRMACDGQYSAHFSQFSQNCGHPEVDRRGWYQRQVGQHLAEPHAGAEFGRDERAQAAQLPQPGVHRQGDAEAPCRCRRRSPCNPAWPTNLAMEGASNAIFE